MITLRSLSSLRRLQLLLAVAALVLVLLPWIFAPTNRGMDDLYDVNYSIGATRFAPLFAVIIFASLLISAMESAYKRRVGFAHMILFFVTLSVGAFVNSIISIPGMPEGTLWRFNGFLLLALVFLASSAMLSTSNDQASSG